MADSTYNLKIKVEADAAEAKTALSEVSKAAQAAAGSPKSSGRGSAPSYSAMFKSGGDTINSALKEIMPGGGSGLASKITGIAGGVVKAGSVLASGIAGAFGPVGAVVGSVIGIFGTLAGGLLNGLGQIGDLLLSIPGMIFGFVKSLAFAVGAAAAAFAGSIYAAHKLMGAAAEDEKYKLQLSRLGAASKLDSYKQVAAEGPQALTEVVRTGVQLESFGLDSNEWMKPIQDAAAMFGKSMDELGGAIGRLKGGQAGEAMEALRNVGVLRSDLERRNIKFDGQGALQSGIPETLKAVREVLNQKTGGMAATMSMGYEGAVSNLGDAVHSALSAAFEKAVPYASAAIRNVTDGIYKISETFARIDWRPAGEALNGIVESAKNFIVGIDWAGWGNKLTGVFTKAVNIVNSLFSAQGIKSMGDTIKNALETGWQGLKNVFADVIPLLAKVAAESVKLISAPSVGVSMFGSAIDMISGVANTFGRGIMGYFSTFVNMFAWVLETGSAKLVSAITFGAVKYEKSDAVKQTDETIKRVKAKGGGKFDLFTELLADSMERNESFFNGPKTTRLDPQKTTDELIDKLLKTASNAADSLRKSVSNVISSDPGSASSSAADSVDFAKYAKDSSYTFTQATGEKSFEWDKELGTYVLKDEIENITKSFGELGAESSTAMALAIDAGKKAAAIAIDKNDPSKSEAAVKAGRADFDKRRGEAEKAIFDQDVAHYSGLNEAWKEVEAKAAEIEDETARKAYLAGQKATLQAFDSTYQKDRRDNIGKINNSDMGIASKEGELANAIKEQKTYLLATNKILSNMLNEIKAMNDYNMTDVAASVFA